MTREIERREFIHASATAFAAAAGLTSCASAAESIEEAVRKVGQLPRRPLGSSGRQITSLVGAETWDDNAVEAGIRCGINFWHKAEDWRGNVPPAILRNREAHNCQVCVDRVRGNHETGQIDEEAHYQLVKAAVQRTGLRYFDDMQFHFGYHSVAELKNNRAFVRAFERLKKEGLVRHLCLSQHSYNGNSRVRGGQSAPEILTAVIEDGVFEHAQLMFTYGDDPKMDQVLALARKKGFGAIAMKTTGGAGRMSRDAAFMKNLPRGTTPHNALARWLTNHPNLDAAVVEIDSLGEFVDTYSGAGKPLRASDSRAIQQMTAYADREVCRLCNQCMSHCPNQVAIADILRCERYALDYRDVGGARRLYAGLHRRADSCVACGTCAAHCPQGLPIPAKLAQVHRRLA